MQKSMSPSSRSIIGILFSTFAGGGSFYGYAFGLISAFTFYFTGAAV